MKDTMVLHFWCSCGGVGYEGAIEKLHDNLGFVGATSWFKILLSILAKVFLGVGLYLFYFKQKYFFVFQFSIAVYADTCVKTENEEKYHTVVAGIQDTLEFGDTQYHGRNFKKLLWTTSTVWIWVSDGR